MRLLDFGGALGISTAAAMLGGCGGSQAPIGAPSAIQPAAAGTQHQNAAAKGPVKILYSFTGSPDGAEPWSGVDVYQGPNTNPGLVGTTLMGGDANNDGTVYGLTKAKKGAWTESVLYTFKGYPYDGSEPIGAYDVPQGDGNYGDEEVTTIAGGASNNGAVVELTPTSSGPWTESFIYSFAGTPDGAKPYGAVIADKAGNLYGTTSAGGTYGAGTVYRMQPRASSYSETVLYSFKSGTDGAAPYAGLIIDKTGALYGTTVQGGSAGYGTVFKLTKSGSGYKESILYSFQGPPNDGSAPYGRLTAVGTLPLAPGGKVIGMSSGGGSQDDGVVYQLTISGSSSKETVLWNFGSVSGDGAYPYGAVLVTKKGVIVGTTYGGGSGGSGGLGTFFTLTPSSSTYKEYVYSFTGANGANPYAGPSADGKGKAYLTTTKGGSRIRGIAAGSDF